jgi:hypothetical protein
VHRDIREALFRAHTLFGFGTMLGGLGLFGNGTNVSMGSGRGLLIVSRACLCLVHSNLRFLNLDQKRGRIDSCVRSACR